MTEERCVWLAQCVCPNGHTILALANEADTLSDAKSEVVDPLHQQVMDLLREGRIEPTCGMCDAHFSKWRFNVARTRFPTIAEAVPYLKDAEAKDQIRRTQQDRLRGSV